MPSEPRVHILKCWPESFRAVVAGTKRHEIRKDDRGYEVGDVLTLREYEPTGVPSIGMFTGSVARVRVTYKTPGGSWGLPADLCVLSVEPCEEPKVVRP